MELATRDGMLKPMGEPDPFSALEALGAEGVEIALARDRTTSALQDEHGEAWNVSRPADREALAGRLEAVGTHTCALLLANDFANQPVEEEVAWTVDAVRAAEALGARAVRVDMVPKGTEMALEAFLDRCIDAAKQVLADTADSAVALGVENHGPITNRPDVLDRIFEGVGDRRMGLTLDSANFYWFGHPIERVYEEFERYAPHTVHTHIKNIAYPAAYRSEERSMGWEYGTYACPLDEGDIDHRALCRTLAAHGYDGPLTLEDESLGKAAEDERPAILKRDMAHIGECAAAAQ